MWWKVMVFIFAEDINAYLFIYFFVVAPCFSFSFLGGGISKNLCLSCRLSLHIYYLLYLFFFGVSFFSFLLITTHVFFHVCRFGCYFSSLSIRFVLLPWLGRAYSLIYPKFSPVTDPSKKRDEKEQAQSYLWNNNHSPTKFIFYLFIARKKEEEICRTGSLSRFQFPKQAKTNKVSKLAISSFVKLLCLNSK